MLDEEGDCEEGIFPVFEEVISEVPSRVGEAIAGLASGRGGGGGGGGCGVRVRARRTRRGSVAMGKQIPGYARGRKARGVGIYTSCLTSGR